MGDVISWSQPKDKVSSLFICHIGTIINLEGQECRPFNVGHPPVRGPFIHLFQTSRYYGIKDVFILLDTYSFSTLVPCLTSGTQEDTVCDNILLLIM